jgi:hypothetical protein
MKTVILSVLIPVLLISCHAPRYMYNPAAQNVPVLAKKGDSKLAAYYSSNLSGGIFDDDPSRGTREKSRGYDLQGAVALTDNFAIQASYFNRTELNEGGGNTIDMATIHYKRNLAELGIGYFTPIGRRDKVLFQVFAGAGKGSSSFTDRGIDQAGIAYVRSHSADVLKLYAQPAFIFRLRENFSIAVSTRLSIINYRNIVTDYTTTEQEEYLLNNLPGGDRAFWEPAFTNSFGFKKLGGVKFEYQFGFSTLMSERSIDYRSFNFALGVMLDLPAVFATEPGTKN